MKNFTKLTMAFFFFVLAADHAHSDSYTGWCFPTDDCMGVQSPIKQNSFETCEETCRIQKPVKIHGMNAIAYDEICRGDSGTNTKRIIISSSSIGTEVALYYISDDFVTRLERCK